ncbi:MAG: DUF4249 domain-containing protein [Bacteroidales bacterium]|jgi:hypothetical protein|nr:DUF4249 domain-containing protein [Bacteroidales bacterium]
MISHKSIRGFLFLGAAFTAASLTAACERATDLRPEGNGAVVVECVLTQDARQTIRLNLTELASPEDLEHLKQAKVRVIDESDASASYSFTYTGLDTWEAAWAGQPSHNYRLEIEVEGYGPVTARTRMPDKPGIKSIVQRPTKLSATNIEEALPENEIGTRFLTESLPDGPVWISEAGTKEVYSSVDAKTVRIATSILNADSFNLTGGLHQFFVTESYAQGLWAAVPVSIQRYPLGFYYYVYGQPAHDRLIRIPSVVEAGPRESKEPDGYFSVLGLFQLYGADWDYPIPAVLFSSLSEEYDRYLKELLIEQKNQDRTSANFASLFKHKNMFSNIENGIGIFGSVTTMRVELSNSMPSIFTY